jgi:hypothetical protein
MSIGYVDFGSYLLNKLIYTNNHFSLTNKKGYSNAKVFINYSFGWSVVFDPVCPGGCSAGQGVPYYAHRGWKGGSVIACGLGCGFAHC